jgi:hypothetical protein
MKRLFLLFYLTTLLFEVNGQSYTITTSATATSLWSATAVSGLTFGLKNTNPYPIKITDLSTYCPATAVTYTLFYNPTLISGAPGALATTNGWIQASTPTLVTPSVAGVTNILSNLSLIIPANTIYRIGIQTSNNGPYYATSGGSADFYSNNGLELYTQANPVSQSYTGPVTGLTTTPRGFFGSITFEKYSSGYNNASVSQLVSPTSFCITNPTIQVKVRNSGKNRIYSLDVNWEVDAILQTPLTLTTLLDTTGGTGINDTVISLGNSISFPPNTKRVIRIWTSMPNGVADTVTNDDTLYTVIRSGLNGTYAIGPLSPDYTSISAAVNDLNKYGICGPVTFNVDAGTSYTENPIILTRTGTLSNPIVFQKNGFGANPIVYGKNGTGTLDAIISLSGASYITFNGIDVYDSISNATANSQMEFGYGITNASATVGSSHNLITNCKVILKRTNTSTIGIAQSTLTVATSLSGGNHSNRFENVKIENSYNGILLQGTAAFPDSNNVITSVGGDTTIVGGIVANDIGNGTTIVTGIQCAEQKNVEISKTIVRNITHSGALLASGIWINNVSTAADYGKAKVYENSIHDLNRITTTSTTAASGILGIKVDVSANASAVIYNNIVYNISSSGTPAAANAIQAARGIAIGSTATAAGNGNTECYHNSVSLNSSGLNGSSSAFWKGAGTGLSTLRNNIFSNTSPAQTGVAKHYAIYFTAGGSLLTSNNVLWAPNANGFIGFAVSDRTSMASFAAAISNPAPSDGNSLGSSNANPNFISTTDLTFATSTPAAQSGITIPSFPIPTDIAGNIRSLTNPTVGAFETLQPLFDSAAPVISNIIISNGASPKIYATLKDNSSTSSAGNIQLWYRIGSSGVFTALTPDSVPSLSMNGTYKWDVSLAFLSIGAYQFYIAARDQVAQGSNIAVNPIQSTSFSGFNPFDPVNYLTNPDPSVNTRTFVKTSTLAGGTYTVGATGNYLNLTAVANALSSAELLGNIIFELQPNYNGTATEVFPITFNELITVGGSWKVTIRPAASATSMETSGYPASGIPLIILNGAKRIEFDGRPGGLGTSSEWIVRSKQTAASSNSPCFVLTNGAQKDTLRYLKIESANTIATSGSIVFTTSTLVGNSNNYITQCDIRNRSDSFGIASVGLYSAGTTGITNDSNTIDACRIFNFGTNGIAVTATGNGNGWIISNNSFYNNLTPTTAQTCISFIPGATSIGNKLIGNFIGGSAPLCAGTAFTNSGGVAWRGIVCSIGTADSSFIQNNTIQNVNLTAITAGSYAGIEMTGGLSSIRTNTIGHPSTANSIQSSQLGTVISIWLNNATNSARIYENTIANITSTGNTTAVGHNGIRVTSGVTTNPLIIRNNFIHHLSSDNPTVSSSTASVVGILSLYAGTQQTISNNTISDLKVTGGPANAATSAIGINVSNAAGIGAISRNTVLDINNISTNIASQIMGIHLDLASAWSVVNNMISLGATVTSDAIISGIMDKSAGTNNTIYYNSVLISGAAISGTSTISAAFRRTANASTTIRNNIFTNTRSTGTGNYAIANTSTTPATGWKANFNDLYTSNAAQLGLWNATATNFSTWLSTSLYDTSSINMQAVFTSTNDLHLTGITLGDFNFAGSPIAGITVDFDNETRSTLFPYMGADENVANTLLPVDLIKFTAKQSKEDVILNWITASENNSSHFIMERSIDGKTFTNIGKIKTQGNSSNSYVYGFTDYIAFAKSPTLYYRLKMVDNDGRFSYSTIVSLTKNNADELSKVTVYPNPFADKLALSFETTTATNAIVEISDISGKILFTKSYTTHNGLNTISIESTILDAGVYFISLQTTNQKQVIKSIKF